MLQESRTSQVFWILIGILFSGLCAWFTFQKEPTFSLRFIPEQPNDQFLLRLNPPFQTPGFKQIPTSYQQATRVKPMVLNSFKGSYQYYQLNLKSHATPLVLNFINHEEVKLVSAQRKALPRLFAWHFAKGQKSQKRHIAYLIEPSPSAQVFYFSVFHRKNLKNRQIQLLSQPRFENQVYRDYYQKGSFILLAWFWLGIGIFQLAYVGNLLWSRQGAEYVWYLLFLLIGAYDFLDARRYDLGLSHWPVFLPTYIFNIHAIITYCYFRFVRLYLSTASRKPALDFQLKTAEWFLLACFVVNLLLYTITQRLDITIAFRDVTLVIGGIINVCLLWGFYRLGSPLVIYLLIGASIIIVSSLIQHANQILLDHGFVQDLLFTDDLTTLGGILDFVCLNIGLNYKHRQENLAHQRAVTLERDRIAQEFHDKAKGLLGLISTISQRAQSSSPQESPNTAIKAFEKIEELSKNVIKAVREIIWMLDSKNDNLEKLILYLYDTAQDYLQYLVDPPIDLPSPDLALNKQVILAVHRREIAFAFHEALQNLKKHAQTDQAQVEIKVQGNVLSIMIRDFGRGFDPEALGTKGNGLNNLQERMKRIGGSFQIASKIGEGTTVVLKYAINKKQTNAFDVKINI